MIFRELFDWLFPATTEVISVKTTAHKKTKKKSIAFIDGDQFNKSTVKIYNKHCDKVETYYIRLLNEGKNSRPKFVDNCKFHKIWLKGYAYGKEVVDKYIAVAIQKAICDGYNHITVVSNDYDFVDIFNMINLINPYSQFSFRIISETPIGRMKNSPSKINNIEIIKG